VLVIHSVETDKARATCGTQRSLLQSSSSLIPNDGRALLLDQNAEWSHTSEQIYNELNSTGMRPEMCYFEVTSISADEPTLPVASYAFAWSPYVTLGFATTFQLHV
jgi:hypothetical protein